MISYIWEITICFIESILITYLLYKKIGLKSNSKIKLLMSSSIITCMLSIFTFLDITSGQRIILILTTCILVTLLLFDCIHRSIWYKAILWPSIYFLIVTSADNISFSIAEAMVDYPLNDLMTYGNARVQFTSLYLLLVAVAVWALCHLGHPEPVFPLPFSLIPFVLIFFGIFAEESVLDISLVLGTNPMTAKEARMLTVLSYLILVILVALLITFEWLGIVLRRNRELKEQQHLAQIEQQHYDLMVSTNESLTEWKHDYQGQLRLMSTLIEQEKYSELKQFSDNLDSALPLSACIIYSGNRTLDAVVSLRIMEAKRHHIKFVTELFLPDRIPLSDLSFSSLIGNLLDNAIEACRKITSGNTEIHFEIKPWKQMLHIFCSNSSDGKYLKGSEGHLLSTKRDKNHHGIGIRRIRQIVEQTGGTCQFRAEDDGFAVNIMIPLEET